MKVIDYNGVYIATNEELNSYEKECYDKFIDLLYYVNILDDFPNLTFTQCIKPNILFYSPYWFYANNGIMLSIYKFIDPVNPILKFGTKQNHIATEFDYPDYIRNMYTDWQDKLEKNQVPLYYYFDNSYCYSHNEIRSEMPMHYWTAYYYLPDGEKIMDENFDGHHVNIKYFDMSPYEMNNSKAIQVLRNEDGKKLPEKKQHDFVHNVGDDVKSGKVDEEIQTAFASNIPNFNFKSQEDFQKFVFTGINQMPKESAAAFVGLKNLSTDPLYSKEVESIINGNTVVPIKSVSYHTVGDFELIDNKENNDN